MTERLTAGDTAPDFTLPDADGNQVTLSELRGQRVIVYFYPAATQLGQRDGVALGVGKGEVRRGIAGGQSFGHPHTVSVPVSG